MPRWSNTSPAFRRGRGHLPGDVVQLFLVLGGALPHLVRSDVAHSLLQFCGGKILDLSPIIQGKDDNRRHQKKDKNPPHALAPSNPLLFGVALLFPAALDPFGRNFICRNDHLAFHKRLSPRPLARIKDALSRMRSPVVCGLRPLAAKDSTRPVEQFQGEERWRSARTLFALGESVVRRDWGCRGSVAAV